MIVFSVTSNIKEVTDKLFGYLRRQIPYATARALTKTAQDVQADVTKELPKVFDRPNPFTMRAIAYDPANKSSLTSRVYIRPIQAAYLGLEITGGTRRPKKKALVLPTDYPTDQYGNIPRGTIKKLLARKDVFSGVVRGIGGIWQRTGHGLILLVSYEPKAEYKPRFDFQGIARRTITRVIGPNMDSAMREAIRTAR